MMLGVATPPDFQYSLAPPSPPPSPPPPSPPPSPPPTRATPLLWGGGYCADGAHELYKSRQCELLSGVHFDCRHFQRESPQYRAWLELAWERCLQRDATTTHVSVWVDAGYRCYRAPPHCRLGHNSVTSWTWTGVSEHLMNRLG